MLTEGLIKKKYNAIVIACLLGWIIALVGELADSILAGQFISETAVSATGLVTPIFNFNFFFSVMIGLGSANRYAIKNGKFDKDEAYRTAGQAMIFSVAAGLLFWIAMLIGKEALFSFYSAGPEVEAFAREYYDGIAIVSLIAPPFWATYYLVYIDGDEKTILASDLMQAFGNFGASLIFVGRMGIKGLALGTVVGTILSWAVLIPHFISKKNSIRFKLGFSIDCLKDVILLGSTTAMTSVYIGIVDVVFNKFILIRFGDALLASYAIVNLLLNMAEVSTCGMDGSGGFIATAYAEKNPVAMKKLLRITLKTMITVGGILTVLFFAFADYIPGVYGIEDPIAYEASIFATRVLALSYIPSTFIFVYLGYMPKIEQPLYGNIASILYSLLVPIIIAIPMGLISYNAMSIGFALTPIVAFAIMSFLIIKKFGKKNFPYPVPDTNATHIFVHEFALKDDEIILVKDTVIDELKTIAVEPSIINKLAVMMEETFVIAKKQNEKAHPGKKILADVTVIVFDNQIKLITRDNGKIFDITHVDDNITSLEAYVAASLMNKNKENSYVTSISFNRNLFCWERP